MPAAEPADPTRRRLAKAMALFAVAAPLAQACGSGRLVVPPAVPEPGAPLLPRLGQSEPLPVSPETDLLFQLIRQRYGLFLSPEQLEVVKRDVNAERRSADRLRKLPLRIDDSPASVYRSYRREG